MPRISQRFPLLGRSIRHKVMLGIFFYLLGFCGLGGMGYYYLTQIVSTLQLSSHMDDLGVDVSDARRSERHYLKYGLEEDHAEALEYVDKATERLSRILEMVKENPRLEMSRQDWLLLPRLHADLHAYKTALLAAAPHKDASPLQAGWQAGETTRMLVLQLRDDQVAMVETLRQQLCWAMLALLTITLAGGWLIVRRILRALDVIEEATCGIAAGNFLPPSVPVTEEETGKVLAAINKMAEELEQRQHKLEQERKLASLGVLTAGIAHQLNNPLNNIFSTCQLLDEAVHEAAAGLRPQPALPEVEQKMGIVLQEVRRSRNIIRGLLDFARESSFSTAPCPLAEVLNNALKLASRHFPAGTRIHNDVPDSIILPLDAQRFQEACINLFINAGEALGQNGGEIRIRAREEGPLVLLEVEDTGEGISSELLPKIFDPFFTGKRMGTGLGLSIAFGIIRKHGGSISARSVPGQGTTFTISLPRRRDEFQEVSV